MCTIRHWHDLHHKKKQAQSHSAPIQPSAQNPTQASCTTLQPQSQPKQHTSRSIPQTQVQLQALALFTHRPTAACRWWLSSSTMCELKHRENKRVTTRLLLGTQPWTRAGAAAALALATAASTMYAWSSHRLGPAADMPAS